MGPYGYFENLQYQNLEKSIIDSNNNDKSNINSILDKKKPKNSTDEINGLGDIGKNYQNKTKDINTQKKESGFGEQLLGKKGENQTENILSFGTDLGKTLSTEASSNEESLMNTAGLTLKGAQAGMSVGGPIGAAIGGAVGLGVGLYDMSGDNGKRNDRKRTIYEDGLERKSTEREQEYLMSKGKESIAKLKTLREAQLNYISESAFRENYL